MLGTETSLGLSHLRQFDCSAEQGLSFSEATGYGQGAFIG